MSLHLLALIEFLYCLFFINIYNLFRVYTYVYSSLYIV